MSFSTVIVLEPFALIDVVRWGINVSHIAANGDDAYIDYSKEPNFWMLKLHTQFLCHFFVIPLIVFQTQS